ncbi:MAG: alpha/beta fold hydrolase, partial [Pseudomonadota bacterium]
MSSIDMTPAGTAWCAHGDRKRSAVVLIHGLGLTLGTWDDHVDALAEHYYVVRYDLAGHGQSALPARPPDLRLYAEQLVALLDHLGI